MDDDEFRDELEALLVEAEGDLSEGTIAGVLTAYLAQFRNEVRLPLGMEPERAAEFRQRLDDRVGEEFEVEFAVTEAVLAELDLQLATFAAAAEAADEE